MHHRRRGMRLTIAVSLATTLALAAPGTMGVAQVPEIPGLPTPPPGTVGPILDPIEDLIEQATAPIDEQLADVPFDNAIRLMGGDAVGAAIALSQATFEGSDLVLLARDDVFADSLSSVAAQGILGAPLLLTQTESLDDRMVAELERLGATEVLILGNEHAIDPALEPQLTDLGYAVDRVGGPSRVETSALLAAEMAERLGDAAPTTAIMIRAYPDAGIDQAQAYADALSVGPYGSMMRIPVLLTTTGFLHPAAEAYLAGSSITEVVIVGGDAAIAPQTEAAISGLVDAVRRVAGATRWETAIAVAGEMGFSTAADPSRIILSEAGAIEEPLWAAGFAAAAHGAVYEAPVILTDGALLPPETISWFGDGLVANALRLSNEPLICNSFVHIIACEAASLLMLGLLDEVNALTGGAIEEALGPVFEPLAEALEEILPGSDGTSPGVIGQVVGLIGVPGDDEVGPGEDGIDCDGDGDVDDDDTAACEEDPDAQLEQVLAAQPPEVRAAFTRLLGTTDDRVSTSEQAVLIHVLSDLRTALGGPLDTSDDTQAAALVTILDAVDATLGSRSSDLPLDALEDLLGAVRDAVDAALEAAQLGALSDLVTHLGTGALPDAGELIDTVAGMLGGSSFASSEDLVDRYGEAAAPLAAHLEALTGR